MGLFKSASTAGPGRPGAPPHSNIRGNISKPIPIADDEFPMRNPGSDVAQEVVPNQLSSDTRRDSAAASISSVYNDAPEEETNLLAQPVPSQPRARSPPNTRRHTNRSSTVRYSNLSEATDSASPSRKKSSFRAAIGKLFKKRNRKQGSRSTSKSEPRDEEREKEVENRPCDHHRSDPVVSEHSIIESEPAPKRSASLPITEFHEALRSHSIGPDDYLAIHSARSSLQSDSVFLRRRANTASGAPIVSRLRNETDILALTPRPAIMLGQDATDEYDPDCIGRAVSVDYIGSRRRSRSLSQLPDVSEEHALVRKRSEEIRYWRASQNLGPLSSTSLSASNREELVTGEQTDPAADTTEKSQSKTDPEPFNFGTVINPGRITQACSLEDRIASLEGQNQKLERLVAKLFQVVPGLEECPAAAAHMAAQKQAATNTPNGETSNQQESDPLSPSYSVSTTSRVSFEDEKTYIGSSIRPPTSEAPRPISNVTVRGVTSLPTISKDVVETFTSDHYNKLRTLLDAERSARQVLEIRVANLAQIIHAMSRSTHYSHVNAPRSGDEPVSTFDHDDDDDAEDEDEPPSVSADDNSDAFKTPFEERPPYGHEEDFGVNEPDDGSRKRAARTLSLGQLTHGKPKHLQKPGAGVDL
ncbi:hypothetical protein F4808DRAFT_220544 [Astrocystis sublimbata]|nr:hypothetical protein F4808DRAFT_220544 [Astrocystis sublimbata]